MRVVQHGLSISAAAALVALAALTASAQNPQNDTLVKPAQRPPGGQPNQPSTQQAQSQRAPGAAAQQQQSLQQRARLNQTQQASQSQSSVDSQLAACLAIDNQKEIVLAQFASQKTQNEEVKAFAQMMIKDHGNFLKELQAVAGPEHRQLTLQGQPAADAETAQNAQDNATETSGEQPRARRSARPAEIDETAGAAGGLDFLTLKQELAEQCLQSTRAELEKKSGAEFDQCYMFGQVMAHMGMVDHLTVFAKHASPEFRQKLDKALQTTKRHLAEAQQIAESLEGTHHKSNAKSTEG
jgi:predicted outer membrane protein